MFPHMSDLAPFGTLICQQTPQGTAWHPRRRFDASSHRGPSDCLRRRLPGQRLLSWMDLACLLLEVCLRTDRSHGDSVILSHMQTLSVHVCRAGSVLSWQPCDSPRDKGWYDHRGIHLITKTTKITCAAARDASCFV